MRTADLHSGASQATQAAIGYETLISYFTFYFSMFDVSYSHH